MTTTLSAGHIICDTVQKPAIIGPGVVDVKPSWKNGKIVLDGVVYRSKAEVSRKAKKILHSASVNEPLTGAENGFMRALVQLHHNYESKKGEGIGAIMVRPHATNFNQWEFCIVRVTGEHVDFSYHACIRTPPPLTKFMKACRTAIKDQIEAFRAAAFAQQDVLLCELTNEFIALGNCHVDHVNPQFQNIVAAFIEEKQIDANSIELQSDEVCGRYIRFRDEAMATSFANFHKKVAKLRVVSSHGNSTRPKRKRKLCARDSV
jgi:hypothetical protein